MKRSIPKYIARRLSMTELSSSRALLQLIYESGTMSQLRAAKELSTSSGAANLHFQKLEYLGLIRRAQIIKNIRGRSTIIWEINREQNFCLTLVFDTPFVLVSLVDFAGRVLLQRREDMTSTKDRDTLLACIDEFIKQAEECAVQHNGVIRQVFIGVPGILAPKTGAVINAANFPLLNGVDFQALMTEKHNIPCYCGPLGLAFYCGEIEKLPPETRAMVFYWDLGVGVAAGVGERIISHGNDDLFLSEVGHVRICRDGKLCHCGRRGCLEAYTGGWAIIDSLQQDGIQTMKELIDAVLSGHAGAVSAVKKAARLLGEHLVWPIQVMQSERLIISGPLSVFFPVVKEDFIEGLRTMLREDEIKSIDPQASDDPLAAMQRGASSLTRRRFFYSTK